MNKKISIVVPNLTELHKEAIRKAAQEKGCELRFFDPGINNTGIQDEYIMSSEIVFGHQPAIAKASTCLRWMCTPFAGVDQLTKPDSFANEEAQLTNSSGAYGVTISEHVLMLLLQILRREPEYRAIVRNKEWRRDLAIRSVYGSRITLLGTGDIGIETAKRLKAFEPKIIIGVNRSGKRKADTSDNKNCEDPFDRIVKNDDLNSVLPETDILIISLPGTKETFHMLNKERLALLPDGAIIINVGRGSVIDQAALTEELNKCRLYAGLDVFEEEPIPQNDPAWTQKNLLLTPHTAGNMTLPHTVDRIVEMFLEDLDNYCAGRPLQHLVQRDRGY